MPAYSLKDVEASIEGPGGSFQIGSGVGLAEEGINIEPSGEANVMTVGGDGSVMHSLKADRSGKITVTLLRTSRSNALLQNLFNYQTSSSRYHGQNTIIVRNPVSGDLITCTDVAFSTQPAMPYATEGGTLAWVFDAGSISVKLGSGTPEL